MRNFILFKDDWKNFPTAVVHGNTRNETFLRQAEAYQRMGVNNCEFLLALLNPELADVDPFDHTSPLRFKKRLLMKLIITRGITIVRSRVLNLRVVVVHYPTS